VVSALTEYHTVVESPDAVEAVVFRVFGELLEGTPAHFVELEVTLVSAL
jgi:hypothetical protein